MERSGITALVNRIIREYYEFGNTPDRRDLLTDDVIAFGVISQYYVQGREQVLNFYYQYQDRSIRFVFHRYNNVVTKFEVIEN